MSCELGDRGECERCDQPGYAQVDPFDAEIHDDFTLHILCDDCADERRMDI